MMLAYTICFSLNCLAQNQIIKPDLSNRNSFQLVNRDDFTWDGKDPQLLPLIGLVSCTHEFGKTIGWKIIEGRDFSTDFKTDSSAVILNEAAVKLTGLKNIIGKIITDENNNRLHVGGVVKNLIMESPYSEIKPTFFVLGKDLRLVNIKLMPAVQISDALNKVQKVFKAYNPEVSFDLKLVTIAIVIASPLAWFIMNKWLQDYAYRISIGWWIFIAAGFAALFIALVTVSFQAIKAAVANPIKSLRTE